MDHAAPALKISGLRKTYRGGREALRGIDLDVAGGDFFALLGPNGAGKSTTIGIISSLVRKSAGRVEVFGVDIDEDFPRAKTLLGLVPQELNFSQFETVLEIVVNQAGYYGIARREALRRAEHALGQLALWDRRDEISRNLSGGMKRRLMIARALVHRPRLLILDEPTAGVDIEIRRSMWRFLADLNAAGTTIILTTHYLEEAEQLCRNIAIIDDGVIIEHSSMRGLLAKLHTETFIVDAGPSLGALPTMTGARCTVLDDHRLEITVDKHTSLNAVFSALDGAGITVHSMRNKANRLEELFMNLVQDN
ncbi:MAG: ABC transporter ATP-binding protein [Gammaproteobacteria bacterium]|nr:ABC transporter ATP-binding protein [Gammaproteobacteria bacterium]MCP5199221.1 ABC transporter ATP-binding protein [Gammaproteobacteria bacterium]